MKSSSIETCKIKFQHIVGKSKTLFNNTNTCKRWWEGHRLNGLSSKGYPKVDYLCIIEKLALEPSTNVLWLYFFFWAHKGKYVGKHTPWWLNWKAMWKSQTEWQEIVGNHRQHNLLILLILYMIIVMYDSKWMSK